MKRALLIIDVQNEYFTGKLPVSYPVDSFKHIMCCMDAANAAGMAVVLIQHSAPLESPVFARGSRNWEIHPEIFGRPHSILIEKTLPGSFTGTGLEAYLREQAVDTVSICGYMTQMCCDTTSRQAFHLGFKVEFLSDATGTLAFSNYAGSASAEELHRAVLVTQAQRFSRVLSSSEWIAALKG